MEDILIFGAKSLALGACIAMEELFPQYHILGFVVSKKEGNPSTLHGLPVMELGSVKKKDTLIYIATPEDTHDGIVRFLEKNGFCRYTCMDSARESDLMGKYFAAVGKFRLLQAVF